MCIDYITNLKWIYYNLLVNMEGTLGMLQVVCTNNIEISYCKGIFIVVSNWKCYRYVTKGVLIENTIKFINLFNGLKTIHMVFNDMKGLSHVIFNLNYELFIRYLFSHQTNLAIDETLLFLWIANVLVNHFILVFKLYMCYNLYHQENNKFIGNV